MTTETLTDLANEGTSQRNMGWLQLTISTGDSTRQLTNALKEQGWMKMQPRLWIRPCVRFGTQSEHLARLKDHVPYAANLRVIFITDKQWTDSVTLVGPNFVLPSKGQ
jgi:CRISPR-associated protein Cas2